MKEPSTIGRRIREQRKKMGMTQEELADRMCVTKPSISQYENDKVDIKGSVIIELAEILNTTAGYLLNNELGVSAMDEQMQEILGLFAEIDDQRIGQVALEQLKALSKLTGK